MAETQADAGETDGAADKDEEPSIIDQIRDPDSAFYQNMYHRMRLQLELSEEEKKEQENFVACFIAQLNRLHEETQEELKKTEESEEEVSEQIGHVEYERLSSDIHRLDKECRFHISNRDMLDSEKESLEHEAKRISKVICLLLCAKQGQALKEEEEELEYVRQRLRVVRKKEEDLEPERNELGYILRYWYELLAEKNQEKSLQNEKDCHKILEEIVKERVKISDLSQKLYENASKEGALKSNTLFYDEQEDEYWREIYWENTIRECWILRWHPMKRNWKRR